jgi:cysteine-rich repeat protein
MRMSRIEMAAAGGAVRPVWNARARVLALLSLFASGMLNLAVAGCGDDDADRNDNNTVVVVCGDGEVQAGEQCDDGADNSDVAPDACRTDCREAYCGDAVVDSGEACDEGGANSDRIANACRLSCQEAGCGDGVVDTGEGCDDGGTEDGDGCDGQCAVEPGWACRDEPSVCACADYRQGEACGECVVYVDGRAPEVGADGLGWATAFPRLQTGIDRAAEQGVPCEVWVAAGRYPIFEHDRLDTVEPRDHVAVLGGFAGDETERGQRDPWGRVTVLDGVNPVEPALRVFHVITAIGTRDATVDGFVITGGLAKGLPSNDDDRGGGLLAYSAQVLFDRCVFLENAADTYGGAVYAYASGGLRFHRTVFSDNRAHLGGAVHLELSPTRLERCTFQANLARSDQVGETPMGGGLYAQHSAPVLHRCRFLGNVAVGGTGGMLIPGWGGAARLEGESGGFAMLSSVFLANRAGEVGGLDLEIHESNPSQLGLVANCTFAANACTECSAGSALRWIIATGGSIPPISAPLFSSLFVANDVAPQHDELSIFGRPTHCLTQQDHCGSEPGCTSFIGDAALRGPPDQPLVESTWTDATYLEASHQSVLSDATQSWDPGALAGLYVQVRCSVTRSWRLILDNDATSLRVWGRAVAVQHLGSYAIVDLRPTPDSDAIDAGMDPAGDLQVAEDLLGTPWTNDPDTADTGDGTPTYVDIGAYEYVPPTP